MSRRVSRNSGAKQVPPEIEAKPPPALGHAKWIWEKLRKKQWLLALAAIAVIALPAVKFSSVWPFGGVMPVKEVSPAANRAEPSQQDASTTSSFGEQLNRPTILGPTEGQPGETVSITATAVNPYGGRIVYGFDFDDDGVVDEWSSAVDSGISASASRVFREPGTFVLGAMAKDFHGNISGWRKHTVTIKSATLNLAPKIDATQTAYSGNAGVPISFFLSATDPESQSVAFGVDYNNDGFVDEWTGYQPSGERIRVAHIFASPGNYRVPIVARDFFSAVSEQVVLEFAIK